METKEWSYNLTFDLGDKVRFKNRIGKDEGMVTGISIRQACISYAITWSNKEERFHYDFELELID